MIGVPDAVRQGGAGVSRKPQGKFISRGRGAEVAYDLVCQVCEAAYPAPMDFREAMAVRWVLRQGVSTGVDDTCERCGMGRLVLE